MIGTYERIASRLLSGKKTRKTVCRFVNGRLMCGVASGHRTPQACRWRLFWRIKNGV